MNRSIRSRLRPLLGLTLMLSLGAAASAQTPAPGTAPSDAPAGVAVRVAAQSDSTQHYAAYTPPGWAPETPRPVLLVMDPRGRALLPLELFRAAAERHGYVILSSYDTLSDADSATVANQRALNALLADAQERFGVDMQRLYLVGFSGTAHYAWEVAPQLDGGLAGIVGVGGGLPGVRPQILQAAQAMNRPPAYVGVVGRADFNYDAVRELETALDGSGLTHRVLVRDGVHAWPPDTVAHQAVDWLELAAQRDGLAPRDDRFLDSLHTATTQSLQRLDRPGTRADALEGFRDAAVAFAGVRDTAAFGQRARSLQADREVRSTYEERDRLRERAAAFEQALRTFADDFVYRDGAVGAPEALRQLGIPALQREAEDLDRPERAWAARRQLATALTQLGFYGPLAAMEFNRPAEAAGLLRIALEIQPDAPPLCYRLAQAEAQAGRADEALEALGCARAGGGAPPAQILSDPFLAPLRNDPRFLDLLQTD